jgi:hypothetical protein
MSSINDEWFVVTNLDELINATRALVFNNFGKQDSKEPDIISFTIHPDDLKEIDTVLSFEESKIIVDNLLKKQTHKITKQIRYMVNDQKFSEIISSLNDRMVSNILNSLVNKGLVETAYDSDSNDFIFWIPNNDNKDENPETD